MKKLYFIVLALVLLAVFIISCSSSCSTSSNGVKQVNPEYNNIKSIVITYYDVLKMESKMEEFKIASEEAQDEYLYWDLLDDYYRSQEFAESFLTVNVKNEYWESIINELKKPKKRKRFSTANPLGTAGFIIITYNNDTETHVCLYRVNYYSINDVWYIYGHGPNFKFVSEIVKNYQLETMD